MKKTTILLSALMMLLLSACLNSGFEKTKSGLMYKIISDKKNPLAKRGDILKVHFTQKVGDSIIFNSREQMAIYAPCDSVEPNYDPKEVFPLCRKGDSVVIIINGDSLYKRGQLPQNLSRKDKIILGLKIIDVFTDETKAQSDRNEEMNIAQAKQMAEMEKRNKQADSLRAPKTKEIEDYLIANKIKYQKGPMGTFIEIKDPGTGMQADSGKRVMVRYNGKSFPGGKTFETNMGAGNQAYPVVIGQHNVIQGWEEGLTYFKKGGKGTLYVPYYLAYGIRPGPGGQPFENLVFDIEIEDVVDNASAPAPNR